MIYNASAYDTSRNADEYRPGTLHSSRGGLMIKAALIAQPRIVFRLAVRLRNFEFVLRESDWRDKHEIEPALSEMEVVCFNLHATISRYVYRVRTLA